MNWGGTVGQASLAARHKSKWWGKKYYLIKKKKGKKLTKKKGGKKKENDKNRKRKNMYRNGASLEKVEELDHKPM